MQFIVFEIHDPLKRACIDLRALPVNWIIISCYVIWPKILFKNDIIDESSQLVAGISYIKQRLTRRTIFNDNSQRMVRNKRMNTYLAFISPMCHFIIIGKGKVEETIKRKVTFDVTSEGSILFFSFGFRIRRTRR